MAYFHVVATSSGWFATNRVSPRCLQGQAAQTTCCDKRSGSVIFRYIPRPLFHNDPARQYFKRGYMKLSIISSPACFARTKKLFLRSDDVEHSRHSAVRYAETEQSRCQPTPVYRYPPSSCRDSLLALMASSRAGAPDAQRR